MSIHKPVHAANLPKPVGPYSPGMNFERLIFVSGQGATDPATGELAGTDVRLRIFGPANEMAFAGHPVIGSTFALADDGAMRSAEETSHSALASARRWSSWNGKATGCSSRG